MYSISSSETCKLKSRWEHYTLTRMANIQKSNSTKCYEGAEQMESASYTAGRCVNTTTLENYEEVSVKAGHTHTMTWQFYF